MKKTISAILICTLAAVSLCMPAAAAPVSSGSSASSSACCPSGPHKGHGGEFGAMRMLSEITGRSTDDLMSQYPQQTAWQIAKKLNVLDQLKEKFLAGQKTLIDKLVAEGKLTAQDGAKLYSDLQKRVAAIDGVNTVILGRPSFRPEIKGGSSGSR